MPLQLNLLLYKSFWGSQLVSLYPTVHCLRVETTVLNVSALTLTQHSDLGRIILVKGRFSE